MNNMSKKKAITMVIATFLIQFFVVTVAANLVPILQPTIVEHYNLGNEITKFNLIYTIGVIVPAVAAPFIPTLYKKIGFKASFIIGAIMSGGGFMAMAFFPHQSTATLPLFWVTAGIFNIGNAIVGSLGIPALLNQWLTPEEKGRFLGIAFMGSSAGAVVANIVFNFIKPTEGNVSTLIVVFGLISVVVGCLISIFIIRRPSEEEYREIHAERVQELTEIKKETISGMTLSEAFRSPIFYFFIIGLICLGLYVSAMSTQYATFIKTSIDGGDDIYLKVALLFSCCAIFGNLAGGFLFDKLKPLKTIIIGGCLALAAVLSLILGLSINPYIVFGFGLFYGLSVFTYIVLPGYMTGYLFGDRDYSQILGICQMIFALGFAVGSVLFGNIVRVAGYNISWILVLVAIVCCYLCFLTATAYRMKLDKNNK